MKKVVVTSLVARQMKRTSVLDEIEEIKLHITRLKVRCQALETELGDTTEMKCELAAVVTILEQKVECLAQLVCHVLQQVAVYE